MKVTTPLKIQAWERIQASKKKLTFEDQLDLANTKDAARDGEKDA